MKCSIGDVEHVSSVLDEVSHARHLAVSDKATPPVRLGECLIPHAVVEETFPQFES